MELLVNNGADPFIGDRVSYENICILLSIFIPRDVEIFDVVTTTTAHKPHLNWGIPTYYIGSLIPGREYIDRKLGG